jgi:hypothetical protein
LALAFVHQLDEFHDWTPEMTLSNIDGILDREDIKIMDLGSDVLKAKKCDPASYELLSVKEKEGLNIYERLILMSIQEDRADMRELKELIKLSFEC